MATRISIAGIAGHARAVMVAFMLLAGLMAATAQAVPLKVEANAEKGFARLLLTFERLPAYEVSIDAGVLVLKFDTEVETNLDEVPIAIPDYIAVARLDPDGKAVRFALVKELRVNTIEAGEQLFVDLLPSNWSGAPPGLPPAVLAELQRRARAASEALRREAERKAALKKKFTLDFKVGEQPTFTHLEFAWSGFVEGGVRRDGDTVTIEFAQAAKADFSRLKVDPPAFINAARIETSKDRLRVILEIDPKSDIKGFREGLSYIVDVFGEAGTDNVATADDTISLEAPEARPADRKEVVEIEGERPAGKSSTPKPVNASKTAVTADPATREPVRQPEIIVRLRALDRDGGIIADQPSPTQQAPTPPRPEAETAGTGPAKAERAAPAAPSVPAAANAQPASPGEPVVSRVEASDGAVRIDFPFTKAVPAAVFRRARTLWIVFESDREIDVSAITKAVSALIDGASFAQSGNARIVRIDLAGSVPSAAGPDGDNWVVTLGGLVVEPTAPVSLKRGLKKDGTARVTIDFERAGGVHWLEDPVVGDDLVVVTGYGPPRGFIKPQAFVEFLTLATAHGIALSPLADDLKVRLEDDRIEITREQGLNLSAGGAGQYLQGRKAIDATAHPGFMDYGDWARGGREEFGANLSRLQNTIALLEPAASIKPRIDLVRFLLAHGLAAEALGHIDRIREIDPQISADPVFNALFGVANASMGRTRVARKSLEVHGLSQDPHARAWLAVVEALERNWQAAHRGFREIDTLLGEYTPALQTMFRLKAVEAALEVNDLSAVESHLAALESMPADRRTIAEVTVLQGRFLEALGRYDEAAETYAEAIAIRERKAEAEATLRSTLMALKRNQLDAKTAIDRLETVTLMWRGDEIELAAMRRLSELYAADGEYRRALEVMRTAVQSYPKKDTSRLIQADMRDLFKTLFADGKVDALAPFEALSLFDDFRALTPPGRTGDEMIRKLADRLADVDLLAQAADLLQYQVDKRLKGAARAQVAARLALVQLMHRKPADALQTIRRTRQAVLPGEVKAQRTSLEARALAELGRAKLAVSLLESLDTPVAERQMADAWWLGEEWQSAGESYERLLGDIWKSEENLTDHSRADVMRAAIAYQLAGDELGLKRFRKKFARKMADTPEAQGFSVVTGTIDKMRVDFRNLAKEIAGVDTLEGFIRNFKATLDPPKKVSRADATDG